MPNVTFTESDSYTRQKPYAGLTGWLVARRVVRNEQQANVLLVVVTLCLFALSGAVWYFGTPHIQPLSDPITVPSAGTK